MSIPQAITTIGQFVIIVILIALRYWEGVKYRAMQRRMRTHEMRLDTTWVSIRTLVDMMMPFATCFYSGTDILNTITQIMQENPPKVTDEEGVESND
jgi:hypothetical protein